MSKVAREVFKILKKWDNCKPELKMAKEILAKIDEVKADPKNPQIHIFLKDGEVSMWVKQYIWHKWMPKTPANYARLMAKYVGKEEAYGPTWWGMHDESPADKGYALVGIVGGI